MHIPFCLYSKRGYSCLFRMCECAPLTESWKIFFASSLVQQLSVSSKKKSSHSACPLWHAFPKLVSSCWGQPSPHWCLQGRLGISIPLSLPFSLLCCSTLNLQLNGNGSGHVSFWVSQNTHFFMSASLLKCVDRASILSSHYHSVLMSNWQMPVSKTSQ